MKNFFLMLFFVILFTGCSNYKKYGENINEKIKVKLSNTAYENTEEYKKCAKHSDCTIVKWYSNSCELEKAMNKKFKESFLETEKAKKKEGFCGLKGGGMVDTFCQFNSEKKGVCKGIYEIYNSNNSSEKYYIN